MGCMRKRITAICLAAFAVSCSDRPVSSTSTPPTAPSTTVGSNPLPGPTAGSYHVTGAVVERTPQGARTIADAGVNIWVDAGRYGYSYWWANGPVHSDAAGNFQLPNLPPAKGWLQAGKDGYVQQCALPVISLDSNANLEVALVARANLSADVASVPASAPGQIVAGRILENTASGTQPVAGAFIDFEPVMDYPAATTYSDADGRYLLCGVTAGQGASIGVGLGPRVTYVPVPPDQSLNLDIVLPN